MKPGVCDRGADVGPGGVVGILVVDAGVLLLFENRYPDDIFDLVLGLDRWAFRVLAYAAFMTRVREIAKHLDSYAARRPREAAVIVLEPARGGPRPRSKAGRAACFGRDVALGAPRTLWLPDRVRL